MNMELMRDLKQSQYNLIINGNENESFICNSYYGTYAFLKKDEIQAMQSNISLLDEASLKQMIDKQFLIPNSQEEISESQSVTPTAFLLPTYDCNLRCVYCFQYMSDSAKSEFKLDMLDEIFNEIETKQYYENPIYLFGGEPLLEKNRPFTEAFMKKLRERNWKFAIFSNGTQVDAYLDLLHLHIDLCDHIHITLDGYEEIHNARRGENTYSVIKRNLKALLEHDFPVKLRVSVDSENYSSLKLLLEDLSDLQHFQKFSVYGAAIRESLFHTQIDTSNFVSDEIRESLLDLQDTYAFKLKNFMGLDFGKAVLKDEKLEQRSTFCRKKLLFDSLGDCYPCISTAGFPELSIANFDKNAEKYVPREDWWQQTNGSNKPECQECSVFYFCGGGCNIEWKQGNVYRCKAFIKDNIRYSIKHYLKRHDF